MINIPCYHRRSCYLKHTAHTNILTPPRRYVPVSPPVAFTTRTASFFRNSHGMTIIRKNDHRGAFQSPQEAPSQYSKVLPGDAVTPLESNHCTIWRANSHRIKSLRTNPRGWGCRGRGSGRFFRDSGEGRQARSSARIGRRRMRLPVPAKIALQTAGAITGRPGSPMPVGSSVLLTTWTSILGVSLTRGMS
jgi:hypothetical protein